MARLYGLDVLTRTQGPAVLHTLHGRFPIVLYGVACRLAAGWLAARVVMFRGSLINSNSRYQYSMKLYV